MPNRRPAAQARPTTHLFHPFEVRTMARTPVFHVSSMPSEGARLSMRTVAIGALALVSLLLTGLLVALVFLEDGATPAWAIPVGVLVLWKMGLFAWVGDLRVGLALRCSPVRGVVLEHSRDHIRRWLLDSMFPNTIEALTMDHMDLSVHWRWTKNGLAAHSFMVRGGPGKALAIQLANGWAVPTIGWDHPALRGLRRYRHLLLEGRWESDFVVSTDRLAVGSAHARLSILAWAQTPTALAGEPA
jgi:hypothetical protein